MPLVETLGKPTISNRDGDPTLGVKSVYTEIFRAQVGDGPTESLAFLVKRSRPFLTALSIEHVVCDLGSAQGTFRREYGSTNFTLLEIDLARFTPKQLGAGNYEHIQATGAQLPLRANCLDVVVSNLAWDFIHPREQAMTELYRVLNPGGVAFLNLNSRKLMIPDDLDDQIARNNRRIQWKRRRGSQPKPSDLREQLALRCKRTYQQNHAFFEIDEQEQLATSFVEQGFYIQRLELCSNNNSRQWWEIDLRK